MFLNELFKVLSENGKYPKYQHERRIDIFVNFYLKSILKHELDISIESIIPEFPLKKKGSFAATNVDYLAYSKDKKKAFFVELKTDESSFNKKQLSIYQAAAKVPWNMLVADVKGIHDRTLARHKEKYEHLLSKLSEMQPESIQIIYIAPQKMDAKMVQLDPERHVRLIYLETIRDMTDIGPFSDEWNVIRHFMCKEANHK